MAAEGVFPKSDGDILYASEANDFIEQPQTIFLANEGNYDNVTNVNIRRTDSSRTGWTGGSGYIDYNSSSPYMTWFSSATSTTASLAGTYTGTVLTNLDTVYPYVDSKFYTEQFNGEDTISSSDFTVDTGSINVGSNYVSVSNGQNGYYDQKNYTSSGTEEIIVLWQEYRSVGGTYGYNGAGLYIYDSSFNKVAISTRGGNGSGTRNYFTRIKLNGDDSFYVYNGGSGSLTKVDCSGTLTGTARYIGVYGTTSAARTQFYQLWDDSGSPAGTLTTKFATHLAGTSTTYQTEETVTANQINTLSTPGKYGKMNFTISGLSSSVGVIFDAGYILR